MPLKGHYGTRFADKIFFRLYDLARKFLLVDQGVGILPMRALG